MKKVYLFCSLSSIYLLEVVTIYRVVANHMMVKQTVYGNYVITFKFTSDGNTFIEDVMIRTDAIIDLACSKPESVNEYFSVMKEALNYSDFIRNKHRYFKVFG